MFPSLPSSAKAITFYVIAFILVFTIAANPGTFGEASPPLSMLTSIVSVLIMMLVVTREGWSKEGWRSLGLFSAGFRGWWLAILLPAACLIISDAILLVSGLASFNIPDTGRSALQIAANIGAGLFISIGFAFCEEIGWRGYMLPKLLGIGAVPAAPAADADDPLLSCGGQHHDRSASVPRDADAGRSLLRFLAPVDGKRVARGHSTRYLQSSLGARLGNDQGRPAGNHGIHRRRERHSHHRGADCRCTCPGAEDQEIFIGKVRGWANTSECYFVCRSSKHLPIFRLYT
jgi:hypothetical protein